MQSLSEMLAQRTHRDLELIAQAHKLPFSRCFPKAQGLRDLQGQLVGERFRRAFQQLTEAERQALVSLQAAGNSMSFWDFTDAFGQIRLYKPWQEDHPRHPWRYPVSAAERLYQLGFIVIEGKKRVCLVADTLDLLPPLPLPPAKIWQGESAATSVDALLTDLAVFLGSLSAQPIQPQWHRWLPPTAFRRINERLSIKEELATVRSELQTGRFRWLHYLAQVSGLMSIQGGFFAITPRAWEWLHASRQDRWEFLMRAVDADLQVRDRLWDQFRFVPISIHHWLMLRGILERLADQQAYSIHDVLTALRPFCPLESHLALHTALLLRDQWHWCGRVTMKRGTVLLHPLHFAPESGASIQPLFQSNGYEIRALSIQLAQVPVAAPLAALLAWASVDERGLVLDQANIRDALAQGQDAAGVIATLHALLQPPVPETAAAQIHRWFKQAQHLTLRHVVLLSSPDQNTINHIRADWRLRSLLAEPLSSRHLAVQAEHSHTLLQRLERRGLPVSARHTASPQRRVHDHFNEDMAEYCLLAVRVYQKIRHLLPVEVTIPGALAHWLEQRMSADAPDKIEQIAEEVMHSLQVQLKGKIAAPGSVQPSNADEIRQMVRRAYEQKLAISIEYYSPYEGQTTSRTIEPLLLYESAGATYLEAFCHLADDERTFRLDRILSCRWAEEANPNQILPKYA